MAHFQHVGLTMLSTDQLVSITANRDTARELAKKRPSIRELRRINAPTLPILADRWPAEFPMKESV